MAHAYLANLSLAKYNAKNYKNLKVYFIIDLSILKLFVVVDFTLVYYKLNVASNISLTYEPLPLSPVLGHHFPSVYFDFDNPYFNQTLKILHQNGGA